jgi:nucleotide-binding universal stress UspA family protein
MNILIATDGSECSDAAIIDLRRAGLPAIADVVVLAMAEISPVVEVVPYALQMAGSAGPAFPNETETETSVRYQLEQAQSFANRAADRLRADFPGWQVTVEAWADGAGSAIVREGRARKPDLIIVGSHGRCGINRLIQGSVSEHVLHHVGCSVRISRHHPHSQQRTIRLLVGVDGSNNARIAVAALAARNWPRGTEARAVGVLDSRIAMACATSLEGTIPLSIEEESRKRMSRAVHEAADVLAKAGLTATHQVLEGEPTETLLQEADKWEADAIFVGARGLNGLARFLLGSVSTSVAAHAHCSVEIVRPNVV